MAEFRADATKVAVPVAATAETSPNRTADAAVVVDTPSSTSTVAEGTVQSKLRQRKKSSAVTAIDVDLPTAELDTENNPGKEEEEEEEQSAPSKSKKSKSKQRKSGTFCCSFVLFTKFADEYQTLLEETAAAVSKYITANINTAVNTVGTGVEWFQKQYKKRADVLFLYFLEGMKMEYRIIEDCINPEQTTVILLGSSSPELNEVSVSSVVFLNQFLQVIQGFESIGLTAVKNLKIVLSNVTHNHKPREKANGTITDFYNNCLDVILLNGTGEFRPYVSSCKFQSRPWAMGWIGKNPNGKFIRFLL